MKSSIYPKTGWVFLLVLAVPGLAAAQGQRSDYKQPYPITGAALPQTGKISGKRQENEPPINGIIFPAAPTKEKSDDIELPNNRAANPMPSSQNLPPVLVTPANRPRAGTPTQIVPQPRQSPPTVTPRPQYRTPRMVPQSRQRAGFRLFNGPIVKRIARFFSGRSDSDAPQQRQRYTRPTVAPNTGIPHKTRARVTWMSRNGGQQPSAKRQSSQPPRPILSNLTGRRPTQPNAPATMQQMQRQLQAAAGDAGRVVSVRQLPNGKIDIQLRAPNEKAAEQLFQRVAGNAGVDPARLQITIDVRP